MIALDASALLAFLFTEDGYEEVEQSFDDACLSTVNLSEVIGRFVRDGHDARLTVDKLGGLPIEVVPFSLRQAELAAQLLPATRLQHGLSLGDRACLGLAMDRGIPALTADRVWRDFELGVTIHCIR